MTRNDEYYTPMRNKEGRWTLKGPGNGIGFYAGALFEGLTMDTEEEAERAARLMNIAFREGQKHLRHKFKALMGF